MKNKLFQKTVNFILKLFSECQRYRSVVLILVPGFILVAAALTTLILEEKKRLSDTIARSAASVDTSAAVRQIEAEPVSRVDTCESSLVLLEEVHTSFVGLPLLISEISARQEPVTDNISQTILKISARGTYARLLESVVKLSNTTTCVALDAVDLTRGSRGEAQVSATMTLRHIRRTSTAPPKHS